MAPPPDRAFRLVRTCTKDLYNNRTSYSNSCRIRAGWSTSSNLARVTYAHNGQEYWPQKGRSNAHQGQRPREDKDEATDHGRGSRVSGDSRTCANGTGIIQERPELRTQLRHGLWSAALQPAGQDQCRKCQASGSGLEPQL